MRFSLHRSAAEGSLLPSNTSSPGSNTRADSAPSEPPPAYAPHNSDRPSGIPSSLLPRRLRSWLNGGASPSSALYYGPSTQSFTPRPAPESDQKQPVTVQRSPYRVQVCPHEFLSFERLERIMSLPGFKGSYKKLEALTAGLHHVDSFASNNRLCKPRPIDYDDLQAEIEYLHSKGQGLFLTTRWFLPNFIVRSSSKSALQDFLRGLDIMLCPHKTFDDPWIIEVLYRMAHPKGRLADPLDQWEADVKSAMDASGSCEARCQKCSTYYTLFVSGSEAKLEVARNLGDGKSRLDPVWLAQYCVEVEDQGARPPM